MKRKGKSEEECGEGAKTMDGKMRRSKREKCKWKRRGCKRGREEGWTVIYKEIEGRSVKGKRERERGEGRER